MKRTSLSISIFLLTLVAILYSPVMASEDPSFESALLNGHKAIVSKKASSPISAGIDRSYGCSRTRCQIWGSRLVCSGNGINIATDIDGCLKGGKMPVEVNVGGETFHFVPSCNGVPFTEELQTKNGNSYMVIGGMCGSTGLSRIFEVQLRGWSSPTIACLPILCQP